jgi:hypothetical protein
MAEADIARLLQILHFVEILPDNSIVKGINVDIKQVKDFIDQQEKNSTIALVKELRSKMFGQYPGYLTKIIILCVQNKRVYFHDCFPLKLIGIFIIIRPQYKFSY